MPKGPQGQKRPADAVANAVMVARIATGEIEDDIEISNGAKGRSAGGNARAATLSPQARQKIASDAANARWSRQQETGQTMTHATTQGAAADRREAVRMYPNNSLRDPVRDYSNKFAEVVRNTFTK